MIKDHLISEPYKCEIDRLYRCCKKKKPTAFERILILRLISSDLSIIKIFFITEETL